MNKTIETSIEISAPAQLVWQILMDTPNYESWNPFLKPVAGPFEKGKPVNVTLNPPKGGRIPIKPVVLRTEYPELAWQGRLLIKGLFDGHHYFRLESLAEDRTRFVHGEHFSGLLVRVLGGGMLTKAHQGFEMMNEALKKRAEQQVTDMSVRHL